MQVWKYTCFFLFPLMLKWLKIKDLFTCTTWKDITALAAPYRCVWGREEAESHCEGLLWLTLCLLEVCFFDWLSELSPSEWGSDNELHCGLHQTHCTMLNNCRFDWFWIHFIFAKIGETHIVLAWVWFWITGVAGWWMNISLNLLSSQF